MSESWERRFAEAAQNSAKISDEAHRVLAGGVTHDARFIDPFPLAVERAQGARKWDPDGNEYIDYVVGHGALLLGHCHPATMDAVREQLDRGTHYGAAHRSEVEWASLVCDLVPSVERVRFTSSGTEAVMLAVRLARAFTGRPKVLKFDLHFHGWSEIGIVGLMEPFDVPASSGITDSVAADVISLSPHDRGAIEERLGAGDCAAVIVEPSGAHFGQVPLENDFLSFLREATSRLDTLLIFDEVITGFRWSPGGVQQRFGIDPDLTTLAKILGGGLPAGAVGGRADIMARLDLRGDPVWDRHEHVFHPGTFNANPLSAAAGIATLTEVAGGNATQQADSTAEALRAGMREVLDRSGVPGTVYGESSAFHVYLGRVPSGDDRDAKLASMRGPLGRAFRAAMLSRGIDLLHASGMLSTAHGPAEIESTIEAFESVVEELAAAKRIPGG